MAAVSLSPPPVSLSATMSTSRRMPLTSNPNVANSPLRASALVKPKRSYANLQREEAYAQPPPAKKQILDNGIPRPLKSPSYNQSRPVARNQLSLQPRRVASTYESKLARERGQYHHAGHHAESTNAGKYTERDLEEIRQWQSHHRARFPRMVFYFDSIPEDVRIKIVKQVSSLGAREEKFFSNEITHVVTTRSIPAEQKSSRQRHEAAAEPPAEASAEAFEEQERGQPETVDPCKLMLMRTSKKPVNRKLFDTSSRNSLTHMQDAKPKRNMDVLNRAREMGKKVWSLDKIQRMLSMLLEPDLHVSAAIAYGSRSTSSHVSHSQARAANEKSLLQLLQNERVNGPSDRDPTVATRELHYFKGPYIYVYDFEEKQKPIMAREYAKVQQRNDGEWPQFRTAPLGRCPFIDDYDQREVVRPKPKKRESVKPAAESKPSVQPLEPPPLKPVTGKRSIGEVESAHTRGSSVASTEFVAPKSLAGKKFEFTPNAFKSRSGTTRLFGGEPVASGLQASNVTSAIRSQMISSTAATPGAIGVLSKEVHGLQRQVLQRNSSHDLSSRRLGSVETSFRDENNDSKRPSTLGRASSRKLELIDEQQAAADEEHEEQAGAHAQVEKRVIKPKKKDPKPGYCENCQDKFADFDEHIASRKHRRFADNADNWCELDDLLSQLQREPRHKHYSTWTPTLPEYPIL